VKSFKTTRTGIIFRDSFDGGNNSGVTINGPSRNGFIG
jgi:hypothetical protein